MARGKGRGGYRAPNKPAAASGPGALSARTDRVPSIERTGLPYGDNKAVNDMQRAAPLNPQGQSGSPAGGGAAPRPALGPEGIFGPTDRPGEPITAGIDFGAGPGAPQTVLADDPDLLLAALARAVPHPELDRLLARRRG